jgi:hypothetical protein
VAGPQAEVAPAAVRADTVPVHRPLLAVASLAALLPAQDLKPSPDELLAAELAAPFLHKAPWLTDWDAALAAAREQHKLIFGYFTTVNY